MMTATLLLVGIFIFAFGWFPVTNVRAWLMFFLCFGLSTVGTFLILPWKEHIENKKMEEALRRIQREEEKNEHE